MPIYAYKCRECGETFEKFRGIHDTDDTLCCPACGTAGPKRAISLFSSKSGSGSVGAGGGFRPT